MGSHHQKFVVLRHDEDPSKDVAFVGGIDLCHCRRDDADHGGDPQALPMAKAYGPTPPWHDVQLMIRGPAVGVLDTVFRERWDDPNSPDEDHPIAWIHDKLHHTRMHADPLPPQLPPPPECGPHIVQNLRTYPADPAAVRVRARRRALGGPRLHEGDQAGPPADLPRGPVHVVRRGGPAVRRGAARAPRAAPGRRRARGSPTRTAPSPSGRSSIGRWQAIEMCQQGRPGPGARVRRGEPRGHAGLRAREGVRGRRRLGQRRQRQLQPPLLDPRQRAVQRRPRHHPRPARARATRPAPATAPAPSPGTCG